jgi:hypothetical protein
LGLASKTHSATRAMVFLEHALKYHHIHALPRV